MKIQTLRCEECDREWSRELRAGRRPRFCNECSAKRAVERERAAAARYRARHPEKVSAYNSAYFEENREELYEKRRERMRLRGWPRRPRDATQTRHYNLRRYGLGIAEYDELLATQNGGCAICGDKPDPVLHVDHCHDTGRVRGLLCKRCNPMIGLAREDPKILHSAADYLNKSSK